MITLLNCNWKYSFNFSQSKGLWPLSFIIFARQPKVTSLSKKIDIRLYFSFKPIFTKPVGYWSQSLISTPPLQHRPGFVGQYKSL